MVWLYIFSRNHVPTKLHLDKCEWSSRIFLIWLPAAVSRQRTSQLTVPYIPSFTKLPALHYVTGLLKLIIRDDRIVPSTRPILKLRIALSARNEWHCHCQSPTSLNSNSRPLYNKSSSIWSHAGNLHVPNSVCNDGCWNHSAFHPLRYTDCFVKSQAKPQGSTAELDIELNHWGYSFHVLLDKVLRYK